jgi:hypothetical protein
MVLIEELFKTIITSALFYCYFKKKAVSKLVSISLTNIQAFRGLIGRLTLQEKERAR